MQPPISLVILISGNGSNLQAIIDAIQSGQLSAKISCVISNNPEAYGLIRALEANIPCEIVPPQTFADKQSYDAALASIIAQYHPDLIVLAGYMRILTPFLVKFFENKIINIHPSLLPEFPGLNTHKKVLEAGKKEHGVSIHFVTDDLDAGPIIAQSKLTVLPEEKEEELKERIHRIEHVLYPLVLKWFSENRIHLQDHTVYFNQQPLPPQGHLVVL
jgi:phosphoribosylglycinamide formyltransferase-1